MAKKSDPAVPSGPVKIRMLADRGELKCGRLAVVDAETAKALVADGSADDHPDAVAYAESLEPADPAPPQ